MISASNGARGFGDRDGGSFATTASHLLRFSNLVEILRPLMVPPQSRTGWILHEIILRTGMFDLGREALTGLMAEERINRKLAAILAADVVGYSRLMASDEEGTLAALKRHRQTVFEPAVAAHQAAS